MGGQARRRRRGRSPVRRHLDAAGDLADRRPGATTTGAPAWSRKRLLVQPSASTTSRSTSTTARMAASRSSPASGSAPPPADDLHDRAAGQRRAPATPNGGVVVGHVVAPRPPGRRAARCRTAPASGRRQVALSAAAERAGRDARRPGSAPAPPTSGREHARDVEPLAAVEEERAGGVGQVRLALSATPPSSTIERLEPAVDALELGEARDQPRLGGAARAGRRRCTGPGRSGSCRRSRWCWSARPRCDLERKLTSSTKTPGPGTRACSAPWWVQSEMRTVIEVSRPCGQRDRERRVERDALHLGRAGSRRPVSEACRRPGRRRGSSVSSGRSHSGSTGRDPGRRGRARSAAAPADGEVDRQRVGAAPERRRDGVDDEHELAPVVAVRPADVVAGRGAGAHPRPPHRQQRRAGRRLPHHPPPQHRRPRVAAAHAAPGTATAGTRGATAGAAAAPGRPSASSTVCSVRDRHPHPPRHDPAALAGPVRAAGVVDDRQVVTVGRPRRTGSRTGRRGAAASAAGRR